MDNLAIWNKYKEVPQNALKDFDNGRFKGTDINTMWRLKSLTEAFGLCGFGWYYDIIKIWNETFTEEQMTMTFAEIKLYIKVDGEWSKGISGVGGNKMLSYTKSGSVKDNDEAVKMAVTDAIGVACRNLGFGADVYWAHDKTKYTNEQVDDKPFNKPTTAQIIELQTLDIDIEKVAIYYKTTVDKLSFEQVQQAIEKKRAHNAKKAQNNDGGAK